MSLDIPTAATLHHFAKRLKITDFVTGARLSWKPSRSQDAAWLAMEGHKRVFVTKPRRMYISTACDLADVLFAQVNDQGGHRVRVGVMLDAAEKVRERIWQMSDFLHQLGMAHEATTERITFPNSSEIVGLTAGGNRQAASTGFQRIRYSEFSFYSDPKSFLATSASLGVDGREVIETTVDIGGANGVQARQVWRDPGNSWHKLFLPFEWHSEYQAEAMLLTEEQWLFCQQEGFKSRRHAAYWLAKLLPDKAGGDLVALMHEYPQRPEHMFQSGAGRWVRTTPRTLEPVTTLKVHGWEGEPWIASIFEPPQQGHEYAIGVDTAAGKERDRSAIGVLDRGTMRLCASFVDDRITGDDLAKVTHALFTHYTSFVGARALHPHVYIEANGIGQATCQSARRLALPFAEITATGAGAETYNHLLESRRAVEGGYLEGPSELAEECDELHRDDHGRWKGRKDLLVACGIALAKIRANPQTITVAPPPAGEDRVPSPKKILRAQLRAQRRPF